MKCREALELMDRVIDGRSGPGEEQLLHFHTAGCRSCKRMLEMNRDISRVFREISRPEPPADLEERVRARLAAMEIRPRSRIRRRYAVALPFVAALLIALGLTLGGGGGQMQSTIDAAAEKAENVGESWKHDVTTPPLTAYIRPASLVTF